MNLRHSYNLSVESAYIIRIQGHAKSESLAERCLESCRKVGQPAQFWDAVNGLNSLPTSCQFPN